jgi:peptide/nickel transport system substrate-binding protein
MDRIPERVDEIRRTRTEVENHVIDELFAGRIGRREFMRRMTVLGMSASLAGFLAACSKKGTGGAGTPTPTASGSASAGAVVPGGTVTTGIIAPATALDPLLVNDEGGLAVLGQSGEYLAWSNDQLQLEPRIAESWSPNSDGSVWTFKIRQGVKFQDGTPLTAEDVAATMKLHADPKNKSNALSAFTGVLSPDGAKATDASTVVFTLQAPNGNFPYQVSSDNYNVIILPKSYSGHWDKAFIGTGPWKMQSYTPDVGVTYGKNPDYWDQSRQPNADTNQIKFYKEDQAKILAIQGGEVNILSQFSAVSGQALLSDPNITVIQVRASQHRQVHMRTDQDPFKDKRTRQAVALMLDRPSLIQGLLGGKSDIGNDSPFAPVFPSTDTSVPQRALDMNQAKQLLSQAGQGSGFGVALYTWDNYEIPDLAQVIQQAVKPLGINIKLSITDAGTYYSKYWLNSPMGITDYGHRGVPNTFLTAPLTSTGTWNAAHFKDPAYDKLVAGYVAELDVGSQRVAAKKIETLLLDETPLVIPYFYFHLSAVQKGYAGVQVTGMGHIDLTQAGATA